MENNLIQVSVLFKGGRVGSKQHGSSYPKTNVSKEFMQQLNDVQTIRDNFKQNITKKKTNNTEVLTVLPNNNKVSTFSSNTATIDANITLTYNTKNYPLTSQICLPSQATIPHVSCTVASNNTAQSTSNGIIPPVQTSDGNIWQYIQSEAYFSPLTNALQHVQVLDLDTNSTTGIAVPC